MRCFDNPFIYRALLRPETYRRITYVLTFVFAGAASLQAQTTYFFTSGQTNPQNGTMDYYDLNTTGNASSDGLLGQSLNTQFLVPALATQSASAVTMSLLVSPNMSTAPTDSSVGASPTGFGFESTTPLTCDIGAGNWHFSTRFALNPSTCSSCTYTFEPKVAVYTYDGTTSTLLWSNAGSPFSASGSESTAVTDSWFKFQSPFTGVAGQYLIVEYYLKIIGTLTGTTDSWTAWNGDFGFNTAQDFVTIPACNPTNTPTNTATSTPTNTVTPTPTYDGCPSWITAGNATQSGTLATLTTNSANQAGAAWGASCINLTQNFNMTFKVYFGAGPGADGIDFVLQNDARGTAAVGGTGGNKGYNGTGVNIVPSAAFALDTFGTNGSLEMEENGSFVNTCSFASTTCPYIFPSSVCDNTEHTYNVVWNAVSKNLSLNFDGVNVMSYNRDLVASVFSGTTCVYYGFTGGTGGTTNLQYVYGVNCFTSTATPTATNSPTNTATQSPTNTATQTTTNTSTQSATNTATQTAANTATNTATATATNTATNTATQTPTQTLTNTPVNTNTSTQTYTYTVTPTNTITNTPVNTATQTPVPTVTITPTPVASPNLPGPNPFTPNLPTNNFVSFNLPLDHGSGKLMLFDLKRFPVRNIGFNQGDTVGWDGKNDAGQVVQGGVYIYLLSVNGKVHRGSITVLK